MLTLYSWGYWGWGSTANRFIEAVDDTEGDRGVKPPVFFDIRAHRSVRAAGFRDDAFGRLLPENRYIWLNGLGNNRAIGHRSGIEIKDPASANTLLEQAIQYWHNDQRVIFFCACKFPKLCHRYAAAKLILKEANRMNRRIQIVEWPGGAAVRKTFRVDESTLKAVSRGLKNVPLRDGENTRDLMCLPWGSIVHLTTRGERRSIITGPAMFRDGWVLPVYELTEPTLTNKRLIQRSDAFRRENGLEPLLTK